MSSTFVKLCHLLILIGSHARFSEFASPSLPPVFRSSGKQGNKPKLTIPSIINFGGFVPIGPIGSVQIQVALDAAQKAGILSDYAVTIKAYDDFCYDAAGVRIALQLLNTATDSEKDSQLENMLPITLGPLCPYQVFTASVYNYYNFVMLAETAPGPPIFYNRKMFASSFSLSASLETTFDAIPPFIVSQGWRRFFLLTETTDFWASFEERLMAKMAKANISLAGVSKVPMLPGELPTFEHFDMTIRELAVHDPRVIVVNSLFGAMLACHLHRLGLHGPKYAYFFVAVALFLPNSQPRAEHCTDKMLFEVLQSVFVFTYGFAIDLNPNIVDSIGTSGRFLMSKLKEEVDHPEMTDRWYFWRAQLYDQTVAGLLALDAVDKTLKVFNDSLLNWTTNTDNFRSNGSFIHSLIKEKMIQLRYNGMCNSDRLTLNSQDGVTEFLQMQTSNDSAVSLGDYTAAISLFPVATYDASARNPVVRLTDRQIMWRTPDGQPPPDTLRIIQIVDPVISPATCGILLGLAALILLVTVVLFGLNLRKAEQNETVAGSFPIANSMILIGNALMACFTLIMPFADLLPNSGKCMAASLTLIVGFFLSRTIIELKLEVAILTAIRPTLNRFKTRPSLNSWRNKSGTQASVRDSTKSLPRTEMPISSRPQPLTTQKRKIGLFIAVMMTFSQLVLASVWFGVEPLTVVKVQEAFLVANADGSIAFDHSSYACSLEKNSKIASGFAILLAVCYGLIAIRSLYLAFELRQCQTSAINDMHFVRSASYATTLIAALGGAVIWLLFSTDLGHLQIAISALSLTIAAVDTAVIFGPKLRPNIYL